MVHIERIQLRYFKSFRNADITIAKGFVALAGPNGSGKSNVCDGIRFALGENSLKALRAKKVADLIMQGSEKAEIKLFLRENGKPIEVRRAIRRDGKTKYRYNGKRMTRTAVMDALRPFGAEIGDHNVIAQGEVDEIVEKSPKERRQIIDAVSGIAEFEEKRNEAMRELEKVDGKISEATLVMNERRGFLAELEKEKDDANRYNELSAELHRLRGSLVYAMMTAVNSEHTQSLDRFLKLEKRIAESRKEQEYKRGQIAQLELEKNALVTEINRRSQKDETIREVEALRAGLKAGSDSLNGKREELEGIEAELARAKDEENGISGRLAEIQAEMKRIEKELRDTEKDLQKNEAERKALLKSAGEAEASFADIRANIDRVSAEIESARVSEGKMKGELEKETGIRKLKEEAVAKLRAEVSGESEEVGKLKADIEKTREVITRLTEDVDRLFDRERKLNKELPNLEKEWLATKERISELSAKIGPTATSIGLKAVLEMRDKNEVRGIHGTVAELCKFKPEYAIAIEASAGNRMEYVVVDSFDVAAKAIEKLKRMKGRCTFIPLDRKRGEDASSEMKGKGLGPLIDFVSFDPEYKSAMSYVFGGTLLIDSVEAAKKAGVGKARMVSLEGDIFEQSGIITGGHFKPKLYLKEKQELELLEKKASGIRAERESAMNELTSVREEMSGIRRDRAEKEVKLKAREMELANANEKEKEKSSVKREVDELGKEIASIKKKETSLEAGVVSLEAKISGLEAERASLRKEAEESERGEHNKMVSSIESEITELKSRKSSLEATIGGKKNELALVEKNGKDNSEATKGVKARAAKLKRDMGALEAEIDENTKKLAEREGALREVNSAVQKLMDRRNELQKSIDEISVQIGKMDQSLERANREMGDISVKKATFETRLADLKAEYDKYQNLQPIGAPKDELETQVKEHEQKIADLGAVNLRAPELYEERKKDIEELKVKVDKLGDEKNAIMRVMNEIDGKKRAVFMETFNQVNDNFRKLFKTVFRGEGTLLLDQPTAPFESGLQIKVKEDKNDKHLEAMSGGEKSLITLLFVMSIHLCRPAPFYLLDEVEAALDKENSKKLAGLVKELSKNTQFIMVTHNDQVLSTADIALGVTRTAEGSKIVGIQLK